jgi:flagellar hook assembly protein FlgD
MAGIPGDLTGRIDQAFVDAQVAKTQLSEGGADGFDTNMFLNMLITQLQNQDPFNTVETEKIMEQQAILTEVEQTLKQTTALEDVKAAVDIGLSDISATLANINNTLTTLVNDNNGSGDNSGGDS